MVRLDRSRVLAVSGILFYLVILRYLVGLLLSGGVVVVE